MEKIFNALKSFLDSAQFKTELEKMEKDGLALPPPSKVIFGTADPSRIDAKTFAVIVPDKLHEEENALANYQQSANFTIAFYSQNDKYENLLKKMVRYSAAFRNAIRNNPALNGMASNVILGDTDFFPDAGATSQTASASETAINVIGEFEILDIDPFN